jgi:predicted RNA-binding Zn ribbon-like protein
MHASNRNPHGAWKNGFLFVGNHLALDFLNTRPLQNGQPVELLPDFQALLRWFEAAGLLHGRDVASLGNRWGGESGRGRQAMAFLRQWRETLRKSALTWECGDPLPHAALDELNRLMAQHPMRTKLKETARGLRTELWFDARRPEDLFAPLAHSAAMLFAAADRRRVRQCGNCVLHFYDTSKKGTRRWCSMQLCGNRLKVAAYAARARRFHANRRISHRTEAHHA